MPPKRKSAQPAEEVAPSRRRSTRLSLGIGAPEIATSTPVSTKNRNKKMATPKTATATPSKPAKAMEKTNETVNGKEAETQSKKRKSAPIKAVDESGEGSEPEAVEEPEEAETAGEEAQNSPEPPAKRSRTSRTQKQTSGSKTPAGEEAQAKPAKNQPKAKGTTTNGTSITETKKGGKQQSKAAESKEEVGGEQQQKAASSTTEGESEKNYWLLKAEPETRLENGVDVKFSIDDLAAKTEPEPWDGIRNYVARNNLRAMKKGDLAFFYHSNCKEPGIVGTMEIVKEHSPDLSAHDPKAPYYDAKSKPSDPKWSVVHVEFRSKFAEPIGLKELRNMGDAAGKPLANMQMLKQSRLSVSKVSKDEWEYLLGVAEGRGKVITRK